MKLLSGLFVILALSLWGCAQEPYLRGGKAGVYHTVKPGETLWRIAKTYQVPLREILNYNHIPDPIHLEVGKRIFIPGAFEVLKLSSYQPLPNEEFVVKTGEGIYHTIKPGETMWRIAKTYGVSLDYLLQVNRISDVAFVEVGRKIFVPGAREVLEIELPKPALPVKETEVSFSWPLEAREVISGFGSRNGALHKGIDIEAPQGTEIKASAGGKVVYSGDKMRGYGNLIILEHVAGFSTVYAHNSENLVQEGDEVEKGQVVGRVGATGRVNTAHLHFEIRKDGQAQDPMIYLP